MTKYIVAQNGVVINIVNAPPVDAAATYWVPVPDAQVVNVGDAFDPRLAQISQADYVAGQVLFNHENRIRAIVQAIELISSSVTGSSAATTAGLPPSANSGQITPAQFQTALLNLLPTDQGVAPAPIVVP